MVSFNEALKVKERISRKMLKRKDVMGIGVGFYNRKDSSQGAAIILYITPKLTSASLKNIPPNISIKINGKQHNVPLRIKQSRRIYANIALKDINITNKYQKKIRPVQAGYSVGYPLTSGTAGITVSSNKTKKIYICSNNHVLNKNNSTGYTETIQPGGADDGKSKIDRVGRLDRFVKLNRKSNYLDAAITTPLKNSLLSSSYPTVGTIPGHYQQYRVGWTFYKVGRTTGPVKATVDSVNTDIKISYGRYGNLGTIPFKNQTILTSNKPISLAGDSGSVWLRASDKYATAINYAGSVDGKLSVSFPIHWAMQVFGTKIARSNRAAGKVKKIKITNREYYTRNLSKSRIKKINVMKAKVK